MPGKQPPPLPGLANPSSFLLEPEPASIVRSMDLFDMESGKAFDTNIWTNKEIASVKFVYVCMIQRGITAIIYFVLRCPPPCSHMSFLADFRPNIHSHRHPSVTCSPHVELDTSGFAHHFRHRNVQPEGCQGDAKGLAIFMCTWQKPYISTGKPLFF